MDVKQYYDLRGYTSVDDQISDEVQEYVHACKAALEYQRYGQRELERKYAYIAHVIFYHIQELRSTRNPSLIKENIYKC